MAAGIAQVGVGYWIHAQGFEAPYMYILACVSLMTFYVVSLIPCSHFSMIIGGKLLSRYLRDATLVQVGLISSIMCVVLTGVAPSNPYIFAVPEGFEAPYIFILACVSLTTVYVVFLVPDTLVQIRFNTSFLLIHLPQGFEAPYIFILACVSLTTVYVIFLVPDTHPQAHPAMVNVRDAIRKILNLVQSNTHKRRLPLLIATIVMLLRVLVFFSLPGLTLLYGMGDPFCWDSIVIGIFSALQYLSGALGMIIGGKLLSRYLRDATLVQVGLISSIMCVVLTGVAPSNPYIFAVPAVGLFRALSLPMLRTIMSKLVYPSEQGVMFACIGCLQSIAMVISPLIFNTLYYATLHIHRGIVFYVMAAFLFIASLLSIVLQVKRQESSFLLLSDPSTSSINRGSRSLLTGRPRNYKAVQT
eukprot:XP_011683828.1 PREDICTED: proton-coupled folate transporter [Strongylocentrotus purpuratus]